MYRPLLVGVAGQSGAGKDTCADFMVSERGFKKHSFASPLKEFCQSLFLLSDEQLFGDQSKKNAIDHRYNLSPRELLQKFGTDFIRNMISDTFWIDRFCDWYRSQSEQATGPLKIVVSDVRFANEAEAIRNLGGRLLFVSRECLESGNQNLFPGSDHISEQSLLTHEKCRKFFDEIIDNDSSTEGLRQETIRIIDSFIKDE